MISRNKTNFIKIILVLITILLIGLKAHSANAAVGDSIAKTFPDQKFAKAIADKYSNGNVNAIFNSNMADETLLELENKDISNIEGIQYFTKLQTLRLHNNKISSLPNGFENITSLERVNLASNNLSSLPTNIGSLNKLISLDLGNNQLTSLPNSIGNLNNLLHFDLYANNIQVLPNTFDKLTKLWWFRMDHNQLTSLPSGFDKLTDISYLYLSYNKLNTFPSSLLKLTKLIEFGIGGNNIKVIPNDIDKLINLKNLMLPNNGIKHIPNNLTNITNLEQLYLDDNEIEEIPDSLTNLSKLNTLLISNNRIHRLSSATNQFLLSIKNPIFPSGTFYIHQSYEAKLSNASLLKDYHINTYSTYSLTNNKISYELIKPDGSTINNANVTYNGKNIIVSANELNQIGNYKLKASIANVNWVYTYNFSIVKTSTSNKPNTNNKGSKDLNKNTIVSKVSSIPNTANTNLSIISILISLSITIGIITYQTKKK